MIKREVVFCIYLNHERGFIKRIVVDMLIIDCSGGRDFAAAHFVLIRA